MSASRAGADVAVVGAGIVGLFAAAELADRGARVTVYERARPGAGQSGGESRIFRHLHDDPRLVALACEARALWRAWEDCFGVELLRADGVVALGPRAEERLAALQHVGGVRARLIDADEAAERLPLLAPPSAPALLDEDGGVIRTTAAIGGLQAALGDAIVPEEALSVRVTARGTVEVRTATAVDEHDRVVVCAGRGTAPLAAGAGLSLPVQHAAHVRLTFAVRGAPPAQLACLLDGSGDHGVPSAYGDPLPGGDRYAVGAGDVAARADGSVVDPSDLAASAQDTAAYVARALPGLVPEPIGAHHCWVTSLPWSHDALAVWDAGAILFVAGNNLFKHAPALGRAVAQAACGDPLDARLEPAARLGVGAGTLKGHIPAQAGATDGRHSS